jgi:hypothetical protein
MAQILVESFLHGSDVPDIGHFLLRSRLLPLPDARDGAQPLRSLALPLQEALHPGAAGSSVAG